MPLNVEQEGFIAKVGLHSCIASAAEPDGRKQYAVGRDTEFGLSEVVTILGEETDAVPEDDSAADGVICGNCPPRRID